ncbi:MAG: orotidine-5'-phosphate decarboxylase [Pirellulaceae bacterium]
MTHFAERLAAAVKRCGNPVMVGLDPRLESLPARLRAGLHAQDYAQVAHAYTLFCRDVIDVVAPLVSVVKPQAAFFEQLGPAGMSALADVIAYASGEGLLVVIDGKRNDIGTTATAYAEAYLGPCPRSAWGGDALTVSPYLGADSLEPFFELAEQREAGVFVLVKTSNPGGGLFQDLKFENGQALYQRVAEFVQQAAERTCGPCGYGAVGAVVGATYPEQLAELRRAMPNTWFLVPGYGAQGAGARDVRDAFAQDGLGAVVNNSRGIIFAYERREYRGRFEAAHWQRAVEAATRSMIEQLRIETPAGQL